MSENYPSDVKLNENPNGTVSFATEVIATIAGLAATEVDGVASMISPSSGLANMFSRKSNRSLTKGVRIDLVDNRVSVDITITVDYGSPVPDVTRNIQENVKKAIETMSGLDVKNVDVHVTGISFEREQRANAELDEQHRKMLQKNAEAEAEAEVMAERGELARGGDDFEEGFEDEDDTNPEDENAHDSETVEMVFAEASDPAGMGDGSAAEAPLEEPGSRCDDEGGAINREDAPRGRDAQG